MENEVLNVHLIQFSPEWGKVDLSLQRLENQVVVSFKNQNQSEKNNAPNLVVLPEMFSTGFKFFKEVAEPMNGKTLQWMQKIAKSLNTAVFGSLLILENDKLFNRAFFVFPDGHYETYDKRHCFVMSDEPKFITPGNKIITIEYAGWRFRPNICHDLRFPVWSRNAYKNGTYDYDVLLTVASWEEARANVWRMLIHARAIENMAYSIGVNRVGTDGDGYAYRGDTLIVNPKGVAVAMANPNEEQSVCVKLSKKELNDFREKFNVGKVWDNYEIKA